MTPPLPLPPCHDAPAVLATLQSLGRAIEVLAPDVEGMLLRDGPDAATIEHARQAALHLYVQALRISSLLEAPPTASAPSPWLGQERRSPQRATNVARLPQRPASPCPPSTPGPEDWEPF